MGPPVLVHATAISIGPTGLIIVGPSGCGKSSMALALLATGRRLGHRSCLIGDDQVLISRTESGILAEAPRQILGMIEIRGSGIGQVEATDRALLHIAITPVDVSASNRIPPENPVYRLADKIELPLLPIDRNRADPFAILEALIPDFPLLSAIRSIP